MIIELQNAIQLINLIHRLYIFIYILLYKLIVEFPHQTVVEGGSPLTSWVPAHLSIHLITGRETGTKTCAIGSVFPPDILWIGLDTYANCTLIYDLL